MPKIDQWIGNLFYRSVQPSELEKLSYSKMKYFNDWHKVIEKAEKDSVPKG